MQKLTYDPLVRSRDGLRARFLDGPVGINPLRRIGASDELTIRRLVLGWCHGACTSSHLMCCEVEVEVQDEMRVPRWPN